MRIMQGADEAPVAAMRRAHDALLQGAEEVQLVAHNGRTYTYRQEERMTLLNKLIFSI